MLFQKSWEFDPLPTTTAPQQSHPNSQEEECLRRLKAQRKQIEELTQKYEGKEKEVEQLKSRERELVEQNEELEGLSQYRDMYDALKSEFQRVYAQAELDSFHAKQTQQEMEETIFQSQKMAEQLKAELRAEKQDRRLAQMQWQILSQQKEEIMRQEKHKNNMTCQEMKRTIESLRSENAAMKKELRESGQEIREWQNQRKKQAQSRQLGLLSSEKQADYWKKQANLLKYQLESSREEKATQLEEKQYDNDLLVQQLHHYKQVNAQLAEQKDQLALTLAQTNTKIHNMQSQYRNEAAQRSRQQSREKLRDSEAKDPQQQDKQLRRVKRELEQAVNECNLLLTDNRRLRGLLERRQGRGGSFEFGGRLSVVGR